MSTVHLAAPLYQPIVVKTASYTVKAEDLGKLFTNRGAGGAVIFTLPTTGEVFSGWWCEFFTAVLAQDVTITAGTVDTMTTFNDLTADSIALSTANERSGAGVRVVHDGTGWLVFLMTEENQTVTVAT